MKNIKYIAGTFFLLVILIPQITFASWWNPFTWFKKKPVTVPVTTQVNTPILNTGSQSNTTKQKGVKKTEQTARKIINSSQKDTDCNIVLMSPTGLSIKNFIAKYGEVENIKCLTENFTVQEKNDCDALIALKADYTLKIKQLALYEQREQCYADAKKANRPDFEVNCLLDSMKAEQMVGQEIPVDTTIKAFTAKYGQQANIQCLGSAQK